MIKKLFSIFFLLLFIYSCEKTFEPKFKSEEKRLNVNAYANNLEGIFVQVNFTSLTNKPVFTEDLIIKDAIVEIVDSISSTKIRVPSNNDGTYYFKKYLPVENNKYKITVNYLTYSSESKFVLFPNLPMNIKLNSKNSTYINNFDIGYKLEYIVSFTDSPLKDYYLPLISKNFKYNINWAYVEKYFALENSCGYKHSIIPDICFDKQDQEWKVEAFISNGSKVADQNIGKYFIAISIVTDSEYFFLINNTPLLGFEKTFLVPSPTYTNMTAGAVGVFSMQNIQVLDSFFVNR